MQTQGRMLTLNRRRRVTTAFPHRAVAEPLAGVRDDSRTIGSVRRGAKEPQLGIYTSSGSHRDTVDFSIPVPLMTIAAVTSGCVSACQAREISMVNLVARS